MNQESQSIGFDYQNIKNLLDKEFVKELNNNNSRKCNDLIIQMSNLRYLDANKYLRLFTYNEVKEYREEYLQKFD